MRVFNAFNDATNYESKNYNVSDAVNHDATIYDAFLGYAGDNQQWCLRRLCRHQRLAKWHHMQQRLRRRRKMQQSTMLQSTMQQLAMSVNAALNGAELNNAVQQHPTQQTKSMD